MSIFGALGIPTKEEFASAKGDPLIFQAIITTKARQYAKEHPGGGDLLSRGTAAIKKASTQLLTKVFPPAALIQAEIDRQAAEKRAAYERKLQEVAAHLGEVAYADGAEGPGALPTVAGLKIPLLFIVGALVALFIIFSPRK